MYFLTFLNIWLGQQDDSAKPEVRTLVLELNSHKKIDITYKLSQDKRIVRFFIETTTNDSFNILQLNTTPIL